MCSANRRDDEALFFGRDLLFDAAAGFEPIGPDDVSGLSVTAGLDYGGMRDASALAVVAALPDLGLNEDEDRVRFIVPHSELHLTGGLTRISFVRKVAATAQGERGGAGFAYRFIASEANGIGQMPT